MLQLLEGTLWMRPARSLKYLIVWSFFHGTFAQRLSDRGDAWWQLGSKFSQRMRKALQGSAAPSDEAFHWTGDNSDAFRVFDSTLLIERLRRENEKGPFHVIAHSHGGMVLWHALMLSVERQIPLDNLRSWITVGTPFISYEARIGRVARHHLMPMLIAFIFSCLLAFHLRGRLGAISKHTPYTLTSVLPAKGAWTKWLALDGEATPFGALRP